MQNCGKFDILIYFRHVKHFWHIYNLFNLSCVFWLYFYWITLEKKFWIMYIDAVID